MKSKLSLILFFAACTFNLLAQDTEKATELIEQGISLHDAGNYSGAIGKYREALNADVNNARALYEMSFSFIAAQQYDSSITVCEQLIKAKIDENILKNVYVNLGTSYDSKNEPEKAIKAYNEGIKRFPDFYLLSFNIGVTYLFNLKNEDKAEAAFQKAIILNPAHASSHYWLFRILENKNKIPAILAASMVCILETNTKRSAEAQEFVKANVISKAKKDSGSNTINIFLPSGSLDKKKENDFGFVDLALSLMQVSTEISDTLKLNTNAEKLSFSYQLLCGSLENNKKQKGFYWKYYAPFFYQIKKAGYNDVVVHLILCNDVTEPDTWLKDHSTETKNFDQWMKDFEWMTD